MNSRLDNIQAAILRVKLKHLEDEMAARQIIASKYNDAFRGKIRYPIISKYAKSAYAQYVLLADGYDEREHVMANMKNAGIPSLIYYPKALHLMKAFGLEAQREDYPITIEYSKCNFGLPMSAFLDPQDQDAVIDCVLEALE